jgi:hypothetical protein
VSSFGRDAAPAPVRLTHDQAEALISARLDGPIDPAANRALLAHLATCPACRAFADQMEAMSTGLRNLPHLPASPTVSRQVRERITTGRPWWSRISLVAGGRFGAMQVAAAMLILLGAVTTVVIVEMVNKGGTGGPQTFVPPTVLTSTAAPTQTPTATAQAVAQGKTLTPTRTPTPLPNVQVTVPPTSTPTPTIQPSKEPTNSPTPTETPTTAPTKTPRSTRTPTPTETQVPPTETATPEPEPTDTPEPTQTPEPTDTPEPTQTPEPTETATAEPTATPTTTNTPTAEPTDTPEPTATDTSRPTRAPRPTRTAEPTETPTITPTPPIVPRTPQGGEQPTNTPTPEPPTETATEESTRIQQGGEPTISPLNGGTPSDETPEVNVTEQGIGSAGANSPTPEEPTQEPIEEPTATPTAEPSGPLANAEVVAKFPQAAGATSGFRLNPKGGLFAIDLGGQITVVDEGGNIVASFAGSSPVWSPKGSVLLYQGGGEVMTWDTDNSETTSITERTRDDRNVVDYAAGWFVDENDNSILLYLRTYPDNPGGAELHGSAYDGSDDHLIGSGPLEPIVGGPVATTAGVWVLVGRGWVLIDMGGNAQGPFTNPYSGVAEPAASPGRSLVAYAAGDHLIVASADSPWKPLGEPIPYGGGGFAFRPDGEQVVIADGAGLAIYAIDGTPIGRLDGTAAHAPGWSDAGIYFVAGDPATLYRASPEQFAPV